MKPNQSVERRAAHILKRNHRGPRVDVRTRSAEAQKQIGPIAKLIAQRKHCADSPA